jgi:NADH-quinone oxidoreductase subunit N
VFNPLRTNRAEFYSFFLFSIMGLMLCAGADDLIWLFLALELTSLPTYIMVAISGGEASRSRAQRRA